MVTTMELPKGFVKQKLLSGRDVILEIDIQGALQVKEKFHEGYLSLLYRLQWKN